MHARLVTFGVIEIDGRRYTHDVVIDAGAVTRRDKKPSKARRGEFGHTPLTSEESIPWGGRRLIVGTGATGGLPLADDVRDEARRRHVEVVDLPTDEACAMITRMHRRDVFAVIHVTC
jgi:hypothetical protein